MILEFFEIFKARVIKHRDIKSEEVFNGRPYTASSAVNLGLIDKIGTYSDAVEEAKKLAKLPETVPVRELKPTKPKLLESLFGLSASRKTIILASQEILAIWPPPTLSLKH